MTGALATELTVLAVDQQQLPEDVGKSGPVGLLLIVVLLIATVLLVKSMGRHLKRIPPSFDPADQIPDTPAELIDPPAPGQDLLDTLRRAPLAIEPPRARPRDDRSEGNGPAAS
ncbi:hypothetical protein SAMN05661080_01518 [Modestobacter sp. DSM 44400]|uniref:hypothetical protein n=1 Tax=Modestobacter sp. DSM 44400 TaxID=1550230 RepID=UPI00089638F6|nr:hypothetical protein [Modestobacter sp. DSM 44400]SDX87136.1 hypothetical protein SAMN05661080_01518 [Modestobacter sp. DSM 44400]